MEDPFDLTRTEFDAVIVGTNLTESLVAAALSRNGKKVLHLDPNSFYGSEEPNFCLSKLNCLLDPSTPPTGETTADDTVTNGNVAADIPGSEQEHLVNVKHIFSTPSVQGTSVRMCSLLPNPLVEESKEPEAEKCANPNGDESADNIVDQAPGEGQPETTEASSAIRNPLEGTHEEVFRELLKRDRDFNVDIFFTPTFSRSTMVDLLVKSGVNRYLDFRSFERLYIENESSLQEVPCSRSDIFTTKELSLVEKRYLMKFVKAYVMDPEAFQRVITEDGNKPFVDFLRENRLSDKICHFIWYGISMIGNDMDSSQVSTKTGLEQLQLLTLISRTDFPEAIDELIRSLWSNAFYFPFVRKRRNQSIHGGIYMLRHTIKKLRFCGDTLCGIVDSTGQNIPAKWVISSQDLHSDSTTSEVIEEVSVARAVLVTDKSLVSGEGIITVVIPPSSNRNDRPIFVYQLDGSTCTVERGKYLLQCWMDVHDMAVPEQAESMLRAALSSLVRTDSTDSNGTKPTALWQGYFFLTDRRSPTISPHWLRAPSPQLLGFDSQIAAARDLFATVLPDAEEFMPPKDDDEPDPDMEVMAPSMVITSHSGTNTDESPMGDEEPVRNSSQEKDQETTNGNNGNDPQPGEDVDGEADTPHTSR